MYPILFIVNIQCKQQMTFQVRGELMPRITCRVGDVPRTCCETQSFPLHPPTSPLFPGPPRGTRWPRWNPDCAVDHLASSLPLWSITPRFLGSSLAHLGHRRPCNDPPQSLQTMSPSNNVQTWIPTSS